MKIKATEATWARALRETRAREGITQRELARRLRVAQETVRAAEMGHPPRHSTLMACLERLPGLQPGALIAGAPAPPVATGAAWRRYELTFGFSARSVEWMRTESAGAFHDEIVVRGIQLTDAELESRSARLAMARAAWLGSAKMLAAIDIPDRDGSQEIAEGGCSHRYQIRVKRGRTEMDYHFSGTRGTDGAIELALAFCARRLGITWERRDRSKVASLQLAARPASVSMEGAEDRLVARMHPGAAWRTAGGVFRCRIDYPMPGFIYSISDTGAKAPRPVRWTLARTLKDARTKAGLSLRDVAKRAGTSAATLLYAESGRDPRASTLEGYLRALPDLAPQDLLPVIGAGGVSSADETWELMRGLHGYEVESITKTVVIESDCTSSHVIDTWGLRALRSDVRDLRVRTALHRAATGASESLLREVDCELRDARLRKMKRADGSVQHEFFFPRSFARGAFSYRRSYAGTRFPLTRGMSRLLKGSTAPLFSGVALPTAHPVRKILIRIRFPGEFLPKSLRSVVLPTCVPADAPMPVLARNLACPPIRVTRDARGTVFTLAVSRPLIGMTHAVSWEVPD